MGWSFLLERSAGSDIENRRNGEADRQREGEMRRKTLKRARGELAVYW
jgi:hypothetical protein